MKYPTTPPTSRHEPNKLHTKADVNYHEKRRQLLVESLANVTPSIAPLQHHRQYLKERQVETTLIIHIPQFNYTSRANLFQRPTLPSPCWHTPIHASTIAQRDLATLGSVWHRSCMCRSRRQMSSTNQSKPDPNGPLRQGSQTVYPRT